MKKNKARETNSKRGWVKPSTHHGSEAFVSWIIALRKNMALNTTAVKVGPAEFLDKEQEREFTAQIQVNF